MAATAKVGKEFLGNEKLGDTRQVTTVIKKSKKTSLTKSTTIAKTISEARYILGNDSKLTNMSAGRQLRTRKPRPAPVVKKPKLKRPGTMVRTAKEGKSFLNRKSATGTAAGDDSATSS